MKTKLTLFALFASLAVALGQLTTTVQPGYSFAPGERVTAEKLNKLGQPTVGVAGTVSGTVGLAADSVTGTHLSSTVVDGITTEFNGSSPRAIKVKTSGIKGDGLVVDGNTLDVDVDGTSIKIVDNKLTLGSTIGPKNVNYGPVTLTPAAGTATMNWSQGLTYQITLGAASTTIDLGLVANMQDGQSVIIAVTQDGTGGRTVVWTAPGGTTVKWRGSAGPPTLTTTGGKTDLVSFIKVGTVFYGNWTLNF